MEKNGRFHWDSNYQLLEIIIIFDIHVFLWFLNVNEKKKFVVVRV